VAVSQLLHRNIVKACLFRSCAPWKNYPSLLVASACASYIGIYIREMRDADAPDHATRATRARCARVRRVMIDETVIASSGPQVRNQQRKLGFTIMRPRCDR